MRTSCSLGRQPVRALGRDAGAHLALEAGDPDHEEFVEVVGRDRQEPDLLEQRMLGILGLLQHAAIEVQPGQFPVDESLRAGGQVGPGFGGSRRSRFRGAAAQISSFRTAACARSAMSVHDNYVTIHDDRHP